MLTQLDTSQSFQFEILYQSKRSRARVGRIVTPHGIIETPHFVAVGTNGTLKTLHNHAMKDCDLQLMFCNTYHLMVQPGTALIQRAGGLHTFIHRNQPIITDSGGFQIFSLAYGQVAKELKGQGGKKHASSVLKVSEEGVCFRSYRNGDKIFLSPESSILAQKELGADIIIPLDELLPFHVDQNQLLASFERTHRWEQRSLETHLKNPQQQAIFGVVHGGTNDVLRKKSCHILSNLAFDGFAIGGSLGCNRQELLDTVSLTTAALPPEMPIHLLGIGDLPSISRCIPMGIDTFDSAYPTKAARHGVLLTRHGPLKITKKMYENAFTPVDDSCRCPTCAHYSSAYLHHLFKAHEPSGASLATLHNVYFMCDWVKKMRTEILCGLI